MGRLINYTLKMASSHLLEISRGGRIMIKEIGEKDLQNIVKFAWELSRDKRKRSFPKIDTYEDMYNIFERTIKDEKDKVLALYENGGIKRSFKFNNITRR